MAADTRVLAKPDKDRPRGEHEARRARHGGISTTAAQAASGVPTDPYLTLMIDRTAHKYSVDRVYPNC